MKTGIKKRLLVGTALAALVSAGLYGCKDFLASNATPQGTLDEGTLSNHSGVEGVLISAYRALDCTNATGWGCAASNWVYGSVAGDDSYKGSTPDDQPPANDLELYNWANSQSEIYLNQKWTLVYEGISRANATLNLMKKVVAANPEEISLADQRSIAGEAIFLRAHYHFEAYRMWGGVPYYREDDADFRKASETPTEVIADIVKDLDSAIVLLPLSPRDPGRASMWTAKAYKGRVQVYAGQWDAALATLTDVKTSGPYALETSMDHVWTGFAQYYNGKETIFAYQASVNDGDPNGDNGNFGERLNFPYSGSPFGCCGFNVPSYNLVNFYRVDAAGLPLALSSPNTWNASDAPFEAGNLTVPVDPRLDWTVGRNKVPYKDWGLVHTEPNTWVRDIPNDGPYVPKKNVHEKASKSQQLAGGWAPAQQNSVRIHLFRYADLLLMLAEVMVEKGDLEGARTIVNQIRTRASQTAQGCGAAIDNDVAAVYPTCAGDARFAVPIHDPSIKWANYQIGLYTTPFPSQDYAREAVRTERRLELAMEGQRLYDLRRWGFAYASAAMNGYIHGEGGGNEIARIPYKATQQTFTQKYLWFPVPDAQLELSKVNGQQMLTQNAGW